MPTSISDFISYPAYGTRISISAGGTTSEDLAMYGYGVTALEIPAGFQTADLLFEASLSPSSSWFPLYDAETGLRAGVFGAAASRIYSLRPGVVLSMPRIRLVSSVTQNAVRSIGVVYRGYV